MTFTISPYLKLLRVPNLAIIILTQYLIRFCVIKPVLQLYGVNLTFGEPDFALLVLSTILIAAAGYIINDYFDIQIDAYNKPDKLIVGKKVKIGTAKSIYAILNGIAFIIGFYLAIKVNAFQLGFIFVMIAIMLWYYSAKYKRQIFWGNLVVAILSALVLLIVWIFEFFSLQLSPIDFIDAYRSIKIINIIIWSYSLFAFMVTLIREMIKDIQDIEGDSKFGCRTLAVVFGVRVTKYITITLIIICILIMAYSQYHLFIENFTIIFWYLLIVIQPLFIYLLINVIRSKNKDNYRFSSNLSKIIMLAGILSMQLVYISF